MARSSDGYQISVIVPALNQQRLMRVTLDALSQIHDAKFARTVHRDAAGGIGVHESPEPLIHQVIVVDGGSSDDTAEIARAAGARVVCSMGCRGRQMNVGAAAAHGNVLLFIHPGVMADAQTVHRIRSAFTDPRVIAGHFWRRTGLFIWRGAFEMAGGFRPYPIYEDMDMARRLREFGRVVRVPIRIASASHRRRHVLLRALYALGASPQWLARHVSAEREIIGPRYPTMRLSSGN